MVTAQDRAGQGTAGQGTVLRGRQDRGRFSVLRETITQGTTTRILDFIYDESGRPFALIYTNGTADPVTYYYVLNLQGDVVKLIGEDGTVVAEYAYNAWGEVLSVTNSAGTEITTATHVGLLNPLRYRGHYYDTETGFYYLQSRYYDPVTHRFINADSYASTGQGIVGTNMFAYCLNNPVNMTDPSGHTSSSAEDLDGNGIPDYLDRRWQEMTLRAMEQSLKENGFAVEVIPNDANANTLRDTSPLTENGVSYVYIVDCRTGQDPNIQVINSYRISQDDMEGIIKYIIQYNATYPSSNETAWDRTYDSLYTEWRAHNDLYDLYTNERCKHVDFNNADEEMSYFDYYVRALKAFFTS